MNETKGEKQTQEKISKWTKKREPTKRRKIHVQGMCGWVGSGFFSSLLIHPKQYFLRDPPVHEYLIQ